MVEVLSRQLDRCEVCGVKIHRKDLVYTQVDFLAVEASNYLTYSSYNSSGWSVDTTSSVGNISIGPYADRARITTTDDNTSTESYGSQTWDGAGTLRSRSGIDASSWTSLVFACDAGPYQQETSPETTFTIGLCDSDGSNKSQQASFTIKGNQRIWFTIDIDDIPSGKDSSDLYFYISTASTNYWWADRLQVAKDVSKLSAFVPTSGSSVDRTDTAMTTVRKVCPNCRERVLSKTHRFNLKPEMREEGPVTNMMQEI